MLFGAALARAFEASGATVCAPPMVYGVAEARVSQAFAPPMAYGVSEPMACEVSAPRVFLPRYHSIFW